MHTSAELKKTETFSKLSEHLANDVQVFMYILTNKCALSVKSLWMNLRTRK